jgi:hypothetical protein
VVSGYPLGSLDTWHHIMCVVDRMTNTISLYDNGVLASAPSDISTVGSVSSANSLHIGSYLTNHHVLGLIDDVRIYNRALSAEEVKQLYLWGLAGGPACAGPNGPAGKMIYNTNFDVLQYCDGENWNAIGK